MAYWEERRDQKIHGKAKEEKKKYRIPAKSEKKIAKDASEKEDGTDAAMDKWFDDRGEELTGTCLFCGGATCKAKPKTFYTSEENYKKALFLQRNSIAHLFAKKEIAYPSIKLRPENSIELCFFDNSCHTNFDTAMITFEDIKYQNPEAWKVIVEKTKILYPCMTEKEKNKVPNILLNEIKKQS